MKTIGILGAGQLARMLALAGYPLGLKFAFYDSAQAPCAANLGNYIQGDFLDFDKLKFFSNQVDVITIENENIPVQTISYLEKIKPTYPGELAVKTCQNRLFEKQYCHHLNLSTVKYVFLETPESLQHAVEALGYPFIIKSCTLGYDGRGQFRINSADDLLTLDIFNQKNSFIAEEYVKFDREISMIASRNISKEMVFYDVCENGHDQGILRQTCNRISDPLFEDAKKIVIKLLNAFDYVGTFTCEFFVLGTKLLINEMAPRVHNSGHWTINGAKTSQFENHLRAILNWPLGDTSSIGRSITTNFIGEAPPLTSLMQHSDIYVRMYDKEARPGRKIGHMTKVIR